MTSFTREEEQTLKTTLALVVVRKRLLLQLEQQQEQQQQQQRDDGDTVNNNDNNNNNNNKTHHTKDQCRQQKQSSTSTNTCSPSPFKKVCTMESLLFSNAATPTMPSVPLSPTTPQLQQQQQQQKGHLQTILATALQTAVVLTNSTTEGGRRCENDRYNNKKEWMSLTGLTNHLAHQVSLDVMMSDRCSSSGSGTGNISTGDNPLSTTTTTTTTTTNSDCWIKEWIRNHFRSLYRNNNSSSDDQVTFQRAAFLVWHGILLGPNYYYETAGFKTKQNNKNNSNNSNQDLHHAVCRDFFVEIFCDLLQKDAGMEMTSLEEEEEEALSRQQQHGSVKTPRSRHAWQRIFSVRNHCRLPVKHPRQQQQQQQQQQQFELMNRWVIHGVQLLQKVLLLPSHTNSSVSATTMLSNVMFLPPTDLTDWYVRVVDEKPGVAAGQNHLYCDASIKAGLDAGAQLMTMVAGYHQTPEQQQQMSAG